MAKPTWRFVGVERYPAAMNMALDEATSISVGKGDQPPTIRLYSWSPSAVTIGRFQGIEEEVNLACCSQNKIDVVRRVTGGGAVFHDRVGEITYSVIAPEGLLPRGIQESYREVCGWVQKGLKILHIDSEYQPINDIVVKGKKISGNAQTRRNGCVWQHGTVLFRVDKGKMFEALKVPDEKVRAWGFEKASQRVTSLTEQIPDLPYDIACMALRCGLTEDKEWTADIWSKEEISAAVELSKGKYSSPAWNHER